MNTLSGNTDYNVCDCFIRQCIFTINFVFYLGKYVNFHECLTGTLSYCIIENIRPQPYLSLRKVYNCLHCWMLFSRVRLFRNSVNKWKIKVSSDDQIHILCNPEIRMHTKTLLKHTYMVYANTNRLRISFFILDVHVLTFLWCYFSVYM